MSEVFFCEKGRAIRRPEIICEPCFPEISARVAEVAQKLANAVNVPLGCELTKEEKKSFWEASLSLKNTPDGPWAPLALKYSTYGSVEWDVAHLRYERYLELVESLA